MAGLGAAVSVLVYDEVLAALASVSVQESVDFARGTDGWASRASVTGVGALETVSGIRVQVEAVCAETNSRVEERVGFAGGALVAVLA